MSTEERAGEEVVEHLETARDALDKASEAAHDPRAGVQFRSSARKLDEVIRSYRQTGRLLDSLGVER